MDRKDEQLSKALTELSHHFITLAEKIKCGELEYKFGKISCEVDNEIVDDNFVFGLVVKKRTGRQTFKISSDLILGTKIKEKNKNG